MARYGEMRWGLVMQARTGPVGRGLTEKGKAGQARRGRVMFVAESLGVDMQERCGKDRICAMRRGLACHDKAGEELAGVERSGPDR